MKVSSRDGKTFRGRAVSWPGAERKTRRSSSHPLPPSLPQPTIMLKRTLLARLAHAPRIPSVSARFHSSDKSPLFSPTFSSPIKPSHSPSSSSSSSSPPAPTSYSDLLAPSPSPTDIPAAPPPPPKLRPSIPFTPWDPDAFHNVGKDEAKRQALERHDAAIRLFTEQDVMPGEIAKIMK